jgi:hypothetical protein
MTIFLGRDGLCGAPLPTTMHVFVSSTCYDLLDLRAELQTTLTEAGMTPVLSDRMDSGFKVVPDANSIETCLANVRACDAFIIVLSRRYGPTLEVAGYAGLSATHVEYQEAVRLGKRIHMYVRDRLEADFTVWKKNREHREKLSFPWCEDGKLFDLIGEHRKLTDERSQSNWLWTFRDSVELKARLRADFRQEFDATTINRLRDLGRVPDIYFVCSHAGNNDGSRGNVGYLKFRLDLGTLAGPSALRVRISSIDVDLDRFYHVLPNDKTETFLLELPWDGQQFQIKPEVTITYSVLEGYLFRDVGELRILCNPNHDPVGRAIYRRVGREYLGREG